MAGYIISESNRKVIVVIMAWIILLNGISIALNSLFEDRKGVEKIE